jgi:hypothetical protein
VRRSVREVLAESHIAAVTIAIFLFWFLDCLFLAFWPPIFAGLEFVFTAVAIFDIPYISPGVNLADRLALVSGFSHFYAALTGLLAANLVSRWVYDMGPLRALSVYYGKQIGRKHA